ncbi:kinase-like domain-containing protein [Xylariaceae sp. FL0804]|nr:kinase-like domain-containing protein [Xylariaceae sp. FL0804]
MADDDDIIAYIYPRGRRLEPTQATEAIERSERHIKARVQLSRNGDRRRRDERESTEPPESLKASDLDHLPCLVVRFSEAPRTRQGLIFGSSRNCDVVAAFKGMSRYHFSLTFDERHRMIIKDLNSLTGTKVTYSGEGGARRDFRWIVGGLERFEQKDITITVSGVVSFRIVVPVYDITSRTYIDNVNRFQEGTATAQEILNDIRLSTESTRRHTEANTPGTGPMYLRKRLGKGGFGVVTRLTDVSTGDECVVKEPTRNALRNRSFNEASWHREATTMENIDHEHIVRYLGVSYAPHPQIYLEYIPRGSLDRYRDISYEETLQILVQCLSALEHLHGLGPTPIAHRDIKEANILVEYRSGGSIKVKLADFGLAKDSRELMTICGTWVYMAPEIYSSSPRGSDAYTTAADIWSLGVVACKLTYGLPRRHANGSVAWCQEIISQLQEVCRGYPDSLGQFLLDRMLILSPRSRDSAEDLGPILAGPPWTLHTSIPGPYSGAEYQAPLQYSLHNYGNTPWSTVLDPSTTTGTSSPSHHHIRSGAPPPVSFSLLPRNSLEYQPSAVPVSTSFSSESTPQPYGRRDSSAVPNQPLTVIAAGPSSDIRSVILPPVPIPFPSGNRSQYQPSKVPASSHIRSVVSPPVSIPIPPGSRSKYQASKAPASSSAEKSEVPLPPPSATGQSVLRPDGEEVANYKYYTEDDLNAIYVGESLAAQHDADSEWDSVFLRDSAQLGTELRTPRSAQDQRGGRHLAVRDDGGNEVTLEDYEEMVRAAEALQDFRR